MSVTVDAPSYEAIRAAADQLRGAFDSVDASVAIVSASDVPPPGAALEWRETVPFGAIEALPSAWRDVTGGAGFRLSDVDGRAVVSWTCPTAAVDDPRVTTFATSVAVELGVRTFVLIGEAMPLNPVWSDGSVGLVSDHINLSGANPLVGPNIEAHGLRFPDMSFVYDTELRRMAREAALAEGTLVQEGVLAHLSGLASLPDQAAALRSLGVDAASTDVVPHAIVARHAGRRVLSILTVGSRDAARDEVVAAVVRDLLSRPEVAA